ncbi:Tcp11-domain-containing protein [Rhizopus microsporus]|uniref:Tcp11-domain-containing protein n=1 Tax=Rhizopus microsporus TaxID=58291 RepID=A0A1X0SF22_RHIZD|nr:Tcp11-domain-containing protein [Rhizopus microsporus]
MSATTAVVPSTSQESSEPIKKKKPSSWSVIRKLFRELELPSPSSPETWLQFNALSQLLHQPKVIVVTTKVLNTALKLVDNDSHHRARVLLTSYMMLMCPEEILQNLDRDEEKKLHDSAKHMLHLFETWLNAHGRPGATAARLAFVEAWNDYNILFESWKSRDRDQLIENMIAYYVQLSTLRQTMIAHQNGDRSVGDQLQQQLDQIKHKLQKIGGTAALEGLQHALEHVTASTSSGRRKQQENVKPRTPDLEEQSNTSQVNKDQLNDILSGYAPSHLTNLQLAHELILEPDFGLEHYLPNDENDLEQRIKEIAERAFFDKIREEIEQGNITTCVPPLVQDIQKRLLSLVRPGTTLYQRIEQGLDLDFIQQQLDQNIFDIQKTIQYVLDTMASMCAPVRDKEIEAARHLDNDPVEQIKRIFHLLDNMSLDLANFRLRALRRPLLPIAVDYEREKFAEMLSSGMIPLVKTKDWLNESCERLCQVAAQRNPEKVQQAHNARPTHDAIFEEAFVSLLSQPQILTRDKLPETLFLDVRRMQEFQNEFQANTMVAALLMLARNFGSASSQALSELGIKLFTMLKDKSTTVEHLAAEIERTVGDLRPERRQMIRNMVDKTLSHNDTVYSLLSRRVALVIKSTIQNKRFVSDAVITSNGLEHIRSNLQALAQRILKLVQHHRQVYASWYDAIIRDALADHVE